jgi:hypothetical protein
MTLTLVLNLNRLKPSINTAMDIMDIYKKKFKEYEIKSANITLAGNDINIFVDDAEGDADTVGSCLKEALKEATIYAMMVCNFDMFNNGLPIIEIE